VKENANITAKMSSKPNKEKSFNLEILVPSRHGGDQIGL